MDSRTRIMKEARALFLPWCLVTGAGLLTWIPQTGLTDELIEPVSSIGFFVGIPLLAALSFGNEFQHRTFAMLLGQPISRMKVWAEKSSVLVAGILIAALVYSIGFARHDLSRLPIAALWVVTSVSSAAFWTLVARSIVGGFILNVFQSTIILLAGAFLKVPYRLVGLEPMRDAMLRTLVVAGLAVLAYGLIMISLGRRQLNRFQATGGIAGDDLLMTSPQSSGGILAGVIRPSPQTPLLNLIGKELRALWPVWLLTVLASVALILLMLVQAISGSDNFSSVALVLIGLYLTLAAILAGTLSLGEERTSGTHSWHLTLPVSLRRQWFVKLSVALLATGFCWGLMVLPTIGFATESREAVIMLEIFGSVALLCVPAFWCACAVRGTLRASGWTFPFVCLIGGAAGIGVSIAMRLDDGWPLDFILARLHPYLFSTDRGGIVTLASQYGWLLMVVPLVYAILQSYRMFRIEAGDSSWPMLRQGIPLAILAGVCVFAVVLPHPLIYRTSVQARTVLAEAHAAVARLQLDLAAVDAEHPRQITLDDLAKVSPPSDLARRWLADTKIGVTPKHGPGTWFVIHKQHSPYFTTIHLRNDWECTSYGASYWHCKAPHEQWGSVVPPDSWISKPPKP